MNEGIFLIHFRMLVGGSKTCNNKEMSALQFGQKAVDTKDFYKSKRITDIYTLDCDKIVVSNSITCNKGKDQRYVVGCKDGGEMVP